MMLYTQSFNVNPQLPKAESDVYQLISDNLKGQESIQRPSIRGYSGVGINYDFYLAEGCKNLNIEPKTYIEVKARIGYNTIDMLHRQAERLKRFKGGAKFLVIYFSAPGSIDPATIAPFNIISFDELKKADKTNGIVEIKDNRNSTVSTWRQRRSSAMARLKNSLIDENITLILGAGVSMDANVPGWDKLLVHLLERAENLTTGDAWVKFRSLLDKNAGSFLITARFILSGIDWNNQIAWMREALYKDIRQSNLLVCLGRLILSRQISAVLTYNYDTLLEDQLGLLKIPYMSVFQKEKVTKKQTPIFHVHGIIPPEAKSDEAQKFHPVLAENDYHDLYGDVHNWSNTLTLQSLHHSRCVLIGLSMTDPNLRRLLDIAKRGQGEDLDLYHFVFLGRKEDEDPSYYDRQETIMAGLGLQVIWYEIKDDSHEDLQTLLKQLQ